MAKTRKQRVQRGGTLFGFLAGLVLGLGIAVVIALFVTRAPVPFVKKSSRPSETVGVVRNGGTLPDPNAPLGSRPPDSNSNVAPPATWQSPVAQPPAAGTPPPAAPPSGAQPSPGDGYLLQAGAFRASDDAEGMKARLALLGFEARVVPAEVNGQPMYRVRIGPFAKQEDAARARARLIDGGIEASVIRQR